MRLVFILLLLISSLLSKEIQTSAKRQGNIISLFVQSNILSTITATFALKTENLYWDTTKTVTKVLQPKKKIFLTKLYIKNPSQKWSLNNHYKWTYGSFKARHKSGILYNLPYKKDTKYNITQSFNGKLSHFGESLYAVDFGMPINTPIHAARGGCVIFTKSNSKKGGSNKRFLKEANQILIEHDDGTVAGYSHLNYQGVVVNVGECVDEGAMIGYSGNSGYSSGPHLHFVVYRPINGMKRQSIKIRFKTKRGILTHPKVGQFYTAL
jgi:murein DD-endopeptidase MepM/ murein hydrolase activator NlpD